MTTLTITLSDSEAATLHEIGRIEHPRSSPAELSEWAQQVAKDGLRLELWEISRREQREAENAARLYAAARFEMAWPPACSPSP